MNHYYLLKKIKSYVSKYNIQIIFIFQIILFLKFRVLFKFIFYFGYYFINSLVDISIIFFKTNQISI